MIKMVIRCPDNTVMVFDEDGHILPVYQGQYDMVKNSIVRNTGSDTVFSYYFDIESALVYTPKEAW